MAKRRRNVPLVLLLFWRRLKSPDGRLAPLAILSIAISVSLATGLEMSSRSAQLQLRETAEAINGAASIEITAGTVGVPEAVLDDARQTQGVAAASPLLSAKVRLVGNPLPLNIVGLDFLGSEQVHSASITRRGVQIRDPLVLLAKANSIVVTKELLDRLGLWDRWLAGSDVPLDITVDGQPKQLIVQGLLEPGGIASAFGGQLAVMDIYALQNLVGREGWFDSVDVATAPDQPVEQVVALLNSRLDGRASVRAAGGSAGAFYEAVEMIQTTALLVAFAGAIAAALTAYATATQWVARQQRQLEILRSVGMSARRMQLGTLIEIALLSLGGFGLGLCGGVVLSPPMLATLSTIAASAKVEQLTRLSISPMTVVVGMLVGIVAPFAGSMIPIARSSRRFALDSGGTEGSHALSFRWLSAAGTLTGVFALSQLAGGYFPGGAFARVSTLFLSGIGLMFSLSPLVLAVWKHLLVLLRRSVPQLSHLVARSFISRPLSFAVSLCAIGSIVAVLTCLALVAKTFEASIDRWTSARYPNGARLVIAGSLFDVNRVELLTPATMRAIRTSKGVLGVDEQYRNLASVLYRGREVQLDMHDMAAIAKYGHIMSIGEDSSSLAKKIANGGVAVSSTFVRNFGLSVGDQLELNTPSGLESFPIVGVIEDFAGPVGTIMLDRSTFDEHWQRRGAWSATIWTEGSETNVVEEIRRRVGGVQDLYIADAEGMAKSNRASASVFNGVLSTIGAFMETLGGVAVAALLLGTIAERRRDLALLRAAGAEPGLLFLLVLADATVVCVSSCIAGLVLGLSCASPAVDVLRESYGWGLDQVWYTKQLAYLAAGTLALGLLGALAPARIAYRSIPTEAFAPD